MNIKKIAQGHFESHPQTDVLHYTADGQGFFIKSNAEAHSLSQKDRTVTTITRAEACGEIAGEVEPTVKNEPARKPATPKKSAAKK